MEVDLLRRDACGSRLTTLQWSLRAVAVKIFFGYAVYTLPTKEEDGDQRHSLQNQRCRSPNFRDLVRDDIPIALMHDGLCRNILKQINRLYKLRLLFVNRNNHFLLSEAVRSAEESKIIVDFRYEIILGRIRHKYLKPYLSLQLRYGERFSALYSYYRTIIAACGEKSATSLSFSVCSVIWQKETFRLSLEQADECRLEGELTLSFIMNNKKIYWITISIFDGSCIGLSFRRVLYVGGIQGLIGSKPEMRAAAKSNGEISPLDMLMIAVRSLASRFRAQKIVGVATADHISRVYAPHSLRFDYDTYWAGLGGTLMRVGYVLDVEPTQKSLSEIPATHRARTRRKRELKIKISDTISQQIANIFPGKI